MKFFRHRQLHRHRHQGARHHHHAHRRFFDSLTVAECRDELSVIAEHHSAITS